MITPSSSRQGRLRPGLRVAAVLAAVGGLTPLATGQDSTFNGGAESDSLFNDVLNWDGGYPGDDFGGNSIIFGLPDEDPFVIQVNVDILNLGGLDNTANNADITFEDDGGSFQFSDGANLQTGTGSFRFDIGAEFLGGVTFDMYVDADNAGSITFSEAVTFAVTNPGDVATFNGGDATFSGDVTVGAGYGFNFDNGVQAAFGNVTFEGDHAFNFEDSDAGGTGAVAVFGGDVTFIDAATLTIGGGDSSGAATFAGETTFAGDFNIVMDGEQTLTFSDDVTFAADKTLTVNGGAAGIVDFSGNVELAGAFSLLVEGDQTVNWSASTELGGDVLINTIGAGDATVAWTGTRSIDLATGLESVNISILTDGADDVSLAGTMFQSGGEFNFSIGEDANNTGVLAQSGLTISGGTLSGDPGLTTNFTLFDASSITLQGIDPDVPIGVAKPNEWAFSSLNDGDAASGSVALGGDFDGKLFIRGGEFSGEFEELGNGDFSVAWTQNESRFSGTADISGAYQARNLGVHTLGEEGGLRADVTGISALDVIQGTMYLENANIETANDGTLLLDSGPTSAALLVIQNNSTVSIGDGFIMEADSMLEITGNSDSGINLEVGGTSAIDGSMVVSATSAGTANASFDGEAIVAGSITQSSSSSVAFGDVLGINAGGTWSLEDSASGAVAGDATVAGSILQKGTSNLAFSAEVDLESGAAWMLDDDSTASIAGELEMKSGSSMSLADGTTLSVTGDFKSAGLVDIDAGAELEASNLILDDGAIMALNDNNLGDTKTVLLDLAEGAMINSGATLFGTGKVELGDDFEVEEGGILMSGVMGATEGLLEISGGDLSVDTGGILKFSVNGDIAKATDSTGQGSIITVDQSVIFGNGASLEVDVQQGAYIPTAPSQGIAGGIQFVLLEANDFSNADNIDLDAGTPSVTREWIFDVEDNAGSPDQIVAAATADYTNSLTGGEIAIGELLNSFRAPANADPNGQYGTILGQLDAIQTASAYQAAIIGFEPTAQVSAIQTAALSQYHDVLRNEIRRRFTLTERRTPAPFRLAEPFQLAGQDAVVERSIRQEVSTDPTAESFGAFWGRTLKTPNFDQVVGVDGNEYGGLGGFGWRLSDKLTVGVDVGYSAFMGNLNGGYGDTRVGTLRGGGFLTWGSDSGLFVDAALTGGWNHFDFNRLVPSTEFQNSSDGDGFQIDGTIGTGYRMALSEGFAFTPNASFLYSYISTGNIDEEDTGPTSAAALAIDPGDLSSFVGRIGADLSWSVLPGLVIDGQVGWQGNFTDNGDYNVGLVGPGASVPVLVENQTINTAYYGLGANWNVAEQIDLNLRWEGRSGDGLNSQMFVGGVTISF
ncbi:MAG: autotransporter domain-containing protein [Phycisphaera sp.]|nr:autotransporter domain-containing protein [Phycisphaera sp.]